MIGPNNPIPFDTAADINSILASFDERKVCTGFKAAFSPNVTEVSEDFTLNEATNAEEMFNRCRPPANRCRLTTNRSLIQQSEAVIFGRSLKNKYLG